MYEVRVEYQDQDRWYPAPHAYRAFASRRDAEKYSAEIEGGFLIRTNLPLRITIISVHVVQVKHHNLKDQANDDPTINADGS